MGINFERHRTVDVFISVCLNGDPIREAYAISTIDYWRRWPQLKRLVILSIGEDLTQWLVDNGLEYLMPKDYQAGAPYFNKPTDKIQVWPIPKEGSYFLRRVAAEQQATTDIYILADDDCTPVSADGDQEGRCLDTALEVLERHPDFAMAHLRPANFKCMFNEEVEIMPHYNTGGVRFTRRGLGMDTLPIGLVGQDDENACNLMRRYGYQVGIFRDAYFFHLGIKSTIWETAKN